MAKNITFGPHDGNFVKSTTDNMKSFPDTKEKSTSKIKKVSRFSCMRVDSIPIFKSGQSQEGEQGEGEVKAETENPIEVVELRDGTLRGRKGIMKPSKEYVQMKDDDLSLIVKVEMITFQNKIFIINESFQKDYLQDGEGDETIKINTDSRVRLKISHQKHVKVENMRPDTV